VAVLNNRHFKIVAICTIFCSERWWNNKIKGIPFSHFLVCLPLT